MGNNKDTKVTLSVGTIAIAAWLLLATITITPQQAHALSNDQKLQQDDLVNTAKPTPPTPTLPTIPTVGCAMDTIENLESFLDCLGAK